jgi:hypothetical protein
MIGQKHTPGPWYTETFKGTPGSGHGRGLFDAVHSSALATIHARASCYYGATHEDTNDDIADANARLIASAPELLQALERILEQTEQATGEYHVATAIIAAAKDEAREAIRKAKVEG